MTFSVIYRHLQLFVACSLFLSMPLSAQVNLSDFVTFSLMELSDGDYVEEAIISTTNRRIFVKVKRSVGITSLTPVFTLTAGSHAARLFGENTDQTSGVHSHDFTSSPLKYQITDDRASWDTWSVWVQKALFRSTTSGLPQEPFQKLEWARVATGTDHFLGFAGASRNSLDDRDETVLYQYTSSGFTEYDDLQNVSNVDHRAPLAFGDYDNDGLMDLFYGGRGSGLGRTSFLYRNTATSDKFDPVEISSTIPGYQSGESKWGDVDNDADLDLVILAQTGPANLDGRHFIVYFNDGDGTFTAGPEIMGHASTTGALDLGDYDGDGDLDILKVGHTDDPNSVPAENAQVFGNDGTGTFTLDGTASTHTRTITEGKCAWVDYDNDGDLDISYVGKTGRSSRGEDDGLVSIYTNGGSSDFTPVDTSHVEGGDRSSSLDWGDFDGDGDSDLIVMGCSETSVGGNVVCVSFMNLYENSNGVLTTSSEPIFRDMDEGDLEWGDFDGDNDLDFIVSGSINTGTYAGTARHSTVVYENLSESGEKNTPPTVPTNLSVTSPSSGKVTLAWDAASDGGETPSVALSYDIFLGATTGQYDLTPGVADPATGRRNIAHRGMIQGTTKTLNLPNGTYYWSVQAVDSAFSGSPLATQGSFTLPLGSGSPSPALALTPSSPSIVTGAADRKVGDLTVSNPAQGVSYTFSLTNDATGKFKIAGTSSNEVHTAVAIDDTTGSPFTIEVTATPSGGGANLVEEFMITVTSAASSTDPTVVLTGTSVDTGAADRKVGDLTVSNPAQGVSYTFSLTNDAAGKFKIAGTSSKEVHTAVAIDDTTRSPFTIEVTATPSGGGANLVEEFMITVTDGMVLETGLTLQNVRLYPNPATSDIHLDLPKGDQYSIVLLSLTHQVVAKGEGGGGVVKVDVSGLASGVYILKVGDSRGEVRFLRVIL